MSDQSDQYFDLHCTGIGYLNRVREVRPERGQAFYAVSINALHGAKDNLQYTPFDCRVSGAEAQQRLRVLEQAVIEDRKVLVAFKIGDLYPDPFEYKSGAKKGRPGAVIKARLLQVRWAKIDGEHVFAEDNRTSDMRQAATA